MKKPPSRHIGARIFFLAYCICMLWLLFGQRVVLGLYDAYLERLRTNINLTPLKTLRLYLRLTESANGYYVRHAYINLIGNVVMFIPLGVFPPWIWRKMRSFFKTAFVATAVIVTVEVLQYVTLLGSCDVDDLLLNLSGVIIGYSLWKLIEKMRK